VEYPNLCSPMAVGESSFDDAMSAACWGVRQNEQVISCTRPIGLLGTTYINYNGISLKSSVMSLKTDCRCCKDFSNVRTQTCRLYKLALNVIKRKSLHLHVGTDGHIGERRRSLHLISIVRQE
jgi:hypothetical protein